MSAQEWIRCSPKQSSLLKVILLIKESVQCAIAINLLAKKLVQCTAAMQIVLHTAPRHCTKFKSYIMAQTALANTARASVSHSHSHTHTTRTQAFKAIKPCQHRTHSHQGGFFSPDHTLTRIRTVPRGMGKEGVCVCVCVCVCNLNRQKQQQKLISINKK